MEHDAASLREEVTRLRLDRLAARASACLEAAGISHVLLKGPTTANWLYDTPRPYRDVDLLIRPSQAAAASEALSLANIASSIAGGVGEEAHHSHLLKTPQGFELDLHVALPSSPVPQQDDEDRYWQTLQEHIVPFRLLDTDIPALDVSGRCVVIALHALTARAGSQALRDLHRARDLVDESTWACALELAEALGVGSQARSALAFADGGDDSAELPLEFRLLAQGASVAYQFRRLARLPLRKIPRQLLEEVFPSKGFMLRRYPEARTRPRLALAHADRLRHLLAAMPRQLLLLVRESRRR